MEIVYQGIDQLDVSFQGAVPYEVREALRGAKARASAAAAPEYLEINGVAGHVLENGAKGGYAFIFDTGPDGETWTFKDRGDVDGHNIRVSVRSAQLAVAGYEGVKVALWKRLGAFGARVMAESVSRVDYAVDFAAPDFEPTAALVVCHSRCSVAEIEGDIPRAGDQDVPRFDYRGRNVETVTVGRQPGRQVCVYNKRAQVMKYEGLSHWLEIWKTTRDDCPVIWRVEVRAGKEHLTEWRIRSFDDLEKRMGDMFASAMQAVRIIARAPSAKENISRVPSHPLWIEAARVVAAAMVDYVSGAERGRIVEGRRMELDARYSRQIFGMLTALAVVRRVPLCKMVSQLPADLAGDVEAFLTHRWDDFRRKYQKAEHRLYFIGEGYAY